MFKRFSFFFIAAVMILSIFAAPALADGQAMDYPSGNYRYTVNSDGLSATITNYTGTETNVTVPLTITGTSGTYNVTAIGDNAFKRNTKVTSVTLQEGVTAIGDSAFNGCLSLTQIHLPDTLKSIAKNAFSFSALQSISIPEGVMLIGDSAFAGCTSLETAALPSTLNTLGTYVFQNCSSLDTVIIKNALTTVPEHMFDECSSLASISLPSSVVSIGDWAFSQSGLKNADFLDNVKDIGDNAFARCYSLKSVALSDDITSIGYGIFIYCSSLESITIPDGVESIGDYAFNACGALSTVTISGSSKLSSIGNFAFCSCTSLKSIDIPAGVSEISQYAFYNCTSLDSVNLESTTLTDGVKQIDAGAFNGCSALESITFPNALIGISDGAFEDCNVLRNAYFIGDVPSSFGNNVFDGCASGFTIYYLDAYDYPNPFHGYLTDTYGPKVTYNVSFDLNNGGAGGTAPVTQTVFKNVKAKTPADPGYTGYCVEGWYTESTCQSANKWSFDTTGVKSGMTLYAKWEPVVYTISYNLNGGSVSGNRNSYTIEDSDIILNAPTKTGYTFASWSGTGIYGTSESVTIPSGSHGNRLYNANWTVNSYNINFCSDGSSAGSGKADFGSLLTAPTGLSKTNYYIEGWYTDDGTFLHKWNLSLDTMPANDLNLYAHWTGVKVKVTLSPGTGAKVTPASLQVSFAGTYGTLPVPAKSGYYFCGWYTGANGTGTLIKAADTVSSAGSITLFAKWVKASTVALSTPSLTVKVTDYKTLSLTWKAVKNAGSYIIYRSIGNSSHFYPIATITNGSLSYADTGLAANKKYYYKIMASWNPYAAVVNSKYSSVKSATPVWATIILNAAAVDYNSINLRWNTLSGATGYNVYRCSTAKGSYQPIATGVAVNNYTDTKCAAGVTYYYKVAAYDSKGAVTLYSPQSAFKFAKTVPGVPSGLILTEDYPGSITVSWNAAGGAVGYEIYRAVSYSGKYTKITSVTDTSFLNMGLATGKVYYYKVRAYCKVGKTIIYGNYSGVQSLGI